MSRSKSGRELAEEMVTGVANDLRATLTDDSDCSPYQKATALVLIDLGALASRLAVNAIADYFEGD